MIALNLIKIFQLTRVCPPAFRASLNYVCQRHRTYVADDAETTLWELSDGSILCYSTHGKGEWRAMQGARRPLQVEFV